MIRRLCLTGALALALLATSIPAAHAATVSPSTWAPKFCTAFEQLADDDHRQRRVNDALDAATAGPHRPHRGTRDEIVSLPRATW